MQGLEQSQEIRVPNQPRTLQIWLTPVDLQQGAGGGSSEKNMQHRKHGPKDF